MPRASRLAAVRESLAGSGADSLLVTDLVNARYLTGFTGSAAVVLVRPDDVVFVTDGRYGVQAAEELAEAGVVAEIEVHTRAKQAAVIAAGASGHRVAIEAASMTVSAWRDWAAALAHDPVETSGLVERIRRPKDAAEIARIRAAAGIAAEAFAQVTSLLSPTDREVDIAVSIEAAMRRLGAQGPSFDTIVASGPNGALPHATPTDRAIGSDPVVVDFGAMVDGYRSDTTRTIALGPVSAEQADAWAAVLESQGAGIAALSGVNVTLNANATVFNGHTVQVAKDGAGNLYFRGWVGSSGPDYSTVTGAGGIPVGYRPSGTRVVACAVINGSQDIQEASGIAFAADGSIVTKYNGMSGFLNVCLDGIIIAAG